MKEFCLLQEEEYARFQETSELRGFLNSREAIKLKEMNGWETEYAGVKEDATVTLQTASAGGTPIPIFIVGEGYNADDIVSGKYLLDMTAQMEHLFSTEPYKTYRVRPKRA